MWSSFAGCPSAQYGDIPFEAPVLIALQIEPHGGGLGQQGDVDTGVDRDGGLQRLQQVLWVLLASSRASSGCRPGSTPGPEV